MRKYSIIAAAVLGCVMVSTWAGPLNPPLGPVASTYKTLSDVEPRTLVNAVNTPGDSTGVFRISAPGSYYLGANVTGVSGKHGIVIASNDVTLDLNGYEVVGVPGSLNGVWLSNAAAYSNVTVSNGNVRGWGQTGVDLVANYNNSNTRIEGVHSSACGWYGLNCGAYGFVSRCTASNIGPNSVGITSYGIVAFTGSSVLDSTANGVKGYGIGIAFGGSISRCWASACTKGGIAGYGDNTITECTATGCSGFGIVTTQDGTGEGRIQISNCTSSGNSQGGIQVSDRCVVTGCNVSTNGPVGIAVVGTQNRIDSNHVTLGQIGIQVTGASNVITRNSVTGTTVAGFSVAGGNDVGPIGTVSTATSPWANIKN